MGWFIPESHELFADIPTAVNTWWDSIHAIPEDRTIEVDLGSLTLVLFGGPVAAARYIEQYHQGLKWSGVGGFWSDGTHHKIMLPYKRAGGSLIINPWAFGHEWLHYLDLMSEIKEQVRNPDDIDKEGYYD